MIADWMDGLAAMLDGRSAPTGELPDGSGWQGAVEVLGELVCDA